MKKYLFSLFGFFACKKTKITIQIFWGISNNNIN
ncbi:hypothetical protein [Enterocloster phage PMBT24]|uniref:Uncharacterized protein n=1 Tax=Enterocloster phage PMBT24 TaxID=3025413 RepID=A0AAT9TS14_9CAUD|nr:hypothetical protein [Enterocloster phage PMBT24]